MKLPKGIYSLNSLKDNQQKTIILVHPTLNSHNSRYLKNINDVIENHEGPIITLDGVNTFDSTYSEFQRKCPGKERYFIKTLSSGPVPVEMDSNKMYEFLISFPSRPIGLGGVFSSGCVRVVLNNLFFRNVDAKLIKGLSYNGFNEIFGDKYL